VEYGTAEAVTTYGVIGVKVWIYKGDVTTRHTPEGTPSVEPAGAGA
jgi:small subunit ribosomal protein S3